MSLKSVVVPKALGKPWKKLGQPVPLSYLCAALNKGKLQATHTKVPGRFSALSGLLPGRSVPRSNNTSYALGESNLRHSALVFLRGKVAAAALTGTKALASQAEKILNMLRRFMGVACLVDETQGFMTLYVWQFGKLQHRSFSQLDCPVFDAECTEVRMQPMAEKGDLFQLLAYLPFAQPTETSARNAFQLHFFKVAKYRPMAYTQV
jgi:hypothetical protein